MNDKKWLKGIKKVNKTTKLNIDPMSSLRRRRLDNGMNKCERES